MKTSITIFIFLLQALFISAFAMNETPVPADSSQVGKSLVVLLYGNEIFGEIISQTDDSVNIKTENNLIVILPIKQLSCIINLQDNYNPNIENKSNKNFMFSLPDKTFGFGQIQSFDGINYNVILDNNRVTKIDSYNFTAQNFHAFIIKSIKWYNNANASYNRIFFENLGQLDCQVISASSGKLKLIVISKYLVSLPIGLFNWKARLVNISDTSELRISPHLIILGNNNEIRGKIISKSKDSLLIKVEPGLAIQISNREIDNIYPNNYYAKNVFYIDAASIIFVGYISANYDFMLNPFVSIRLGAGLGYEISFSGSSGYYKGATCMINFLPGGKNSKFEFGIGASYVMKDREYYESKYNDKVSVAFTIGYRYQNQYKGMLFRIGCSSLGYGGGIHLSLGYAF